MTTPPSTGGKSEEFSPCHSVNDCGGRRHSSVVRYLLEKGADVNARDREGNTVLAYAKARRELFDPPRRDE